MTAFEKASSYQLPLWKPLYHLKGILANLLSAYGSGYAYYYFFSIGDNVTDLFPYWDFRFWVAFVIGGIVQAVLWDIFTSQGIENMREYFRENSDENQPDIIKIAKKASNFTLHLSLGKIAGRYSAILGMSIILFTQIDYFRQEMSTKSYLLGSKESQLKEANKQLQTIENIQIEETETYKDIIRDKNDGDSGNDQRADKRMNSLFTAHLAKVSYFRNKAANLNNEIEDAKRSSISMNSTALFSFLGGSEYMATVILLISVWLAAYMIDEGCARYGLRIGEHRTCKNLLKAEKIIEPQETTLTSGVDWDTERNQAILRVLKSKYGEYDHKKGKKISFEDIGGEFDCTKQAIHEKYTAAIKDGLLAA